MDEKKSSQNDTFSKYTVYLAILMIAAGLFGLVYGATKAFKVDLNDWFMYGQYSSLPLLLLGIMEIVAFSIVTVTGINLLRTRNTCVTSKRVTEKIKPACIAYFAGLVLLLLSYFIFREEMLEGLITHVVYFYYPIVALPLFYGMSRMLENRSGRTKQPVFLWILASALLFLATIYEVANLFPQ